MDSILPPTIIDLTFKKDDLEEAIRNMDIGEGTHLKPIPLDPFVRTPLSGLLTIPKGEVFGICLDFSNISFESKLHYMKFKNHDKSCTTFMTREEWQKYFEFEKGDLTKIAAPDGSLFITPENKGGMQVCSIQTKNENEQNSRDIFISYTVVLSFVIDKKHYYFRIDPLVKISSKHGL